MTRPSSTPPSSTPSSSTRPPEARPHGLPAVALNVLGQWWVLALVLVLAAGALGVVTGLKSDVSTGVLFRVDPAASDSTRVTQSTQTAVRLIDATDVYAAAATGAGTSPLELRQATTVAVVPSSELVSLAVRCRAADVCYRRLDALVGAVEQRLTRTAEDRFAAIAAVGGSALTDGALPDAEAERSRRQELGAQAAERQDGALAAGTAIALVGRPSPLERTGLTPTVGGSLGVVTGLLVAAIVLLALGGRFGRIRRARDWFVRRGRPQVFEGDDVGGLAQQLVADRIPLVLVLPAGKASTRETAHLARTLQTEMETEGAATALVRIHRGQATLVGAEGTSIARVPSPLAKASRGELLARCQAHVAVAYADTPLTDGHRARGRVPATVFLAAGRDGSYRSLTRAFASMAPTPSYAVLV